MFGGPGPGQELVDPRDRVIGEAGQDVLEVGEGAVEVAIHSALFAEILRLIDRLQLAPLPA